MNILGCRIIRFSLYGIAAFALTACGENGTASAETANRPDLIHTVGGTVTGLVGQGLTIELLNLANLTHNATVVEQIDIVTNGAFVFRIPPSQGYRVAIVHQPHAPMQRCMVRSNRGVIGATDVSNVDIVCGDLI